MHVENKPRPTKSPTFDRLASAPLRNQACSVTLAASASRRRARTCLSASHLNAVLHVGSTDADAVDARLDLTSPTRPVQAASAARCASAPPRRLLRHRELPPNYVAEVLDPMSIAEPSDPQCGLRRGARPTPRLRAPPALRLRCSDSDDAATPAAEAEATGTARATAVPLPYTDRTIPPVTGISVPRPPRSALRGDPSSAMPSAPVLAFTKSVCAPKSPPPHRGTSTRPSWAERIDALRVHSAVRACSVSGRAEGGQGGEDRGTCASTARRSEESNVMGWPAERRFEHKSASLQRDGVMICTRNGYAVAAQKPNAAFMTLDGLRRRRDGDMFGLDVKIMFIGITKHAQMFSKALRQISWTRHAKWVLTFAPFEQASHAGCGLVYENSLVFGASTEPQDTHASPRAFAPPVLVVFLAVLEANGLCRLRW
ncbi:hypothetical protein DFH11DRAFT_1885305 [Phellopilus nigrolimitatus]|nr:hypothetical protein DFH11DRAFT_1885305 [Phellopilus nigrolimitatus]